MNASACVNTICRRHLHNSTKSYYTHYWTASSQSVKVSLHSFQSKYVQYQSFITLAAIGIKQSVTYGTINVGMVGNF